jgi:transcriptional regulator with XRE-family HTH domain
MPQTRRLSLRALAILAGFDSIKDLAVPTGISVSYLYCIAAGYRPSPDKLAAVARALEVSEGRVLEAIRRD